MMSLENWSQIAAIVAVLVAVLDLLLRRKNKIQKKGYAAKASTSGTAVAGNHNIVLHGDAPTLNLGNAPVSKQGSLRFSVILWCFIVTMVLIWASYETFIRPRVEKWMVFMEAIRVFVPADVRTSFEDYSQKIIDLERNTKALSAQIYGKPDSPELEDLKKRLYDIQGPYNFLNEQRRISKEPVVNNIHDQLKDGKILANAYDVENETLTIIPTQYWYSMNIGGEQLNEAGGPGFHHYRSLLLGQNPCYATASNIQALRCTFPLARP
jgi:hypothetical protein